jgi:predicted RNA binding protein YcfA (HicA-like mRNA interferase family)
MDKRERFIAELRNEAKQQGLKFKKEQWRGKGSHTMVWVGDKVTTVPSREIDPKTARKIRKTLGLG